jgi:hypothetical protein
MTDLTSDDEVVSRIDRITDVELRQLFTDNDEIARPFLRRYSADGTVVPYETLMRSLSMHQQEEMEHYEAALERKHALQDHCRQGMTILDDIMGSGGWPGQENQYIKLCNIFRDIHSCHDDDARFDEE